MSVVRRWRATNCHEKGQIPLVLYKYLKRYLKSFAILMTFLGPEESIDTHTYCMGAPYNRHQPLGKTKPQRVVRQLDQGRNEIGRRGAFLAFGSNADNCPNRKVGKP